jgi:prepilin-type N-terminal cleavage/methylation domain-containing protein
MRPVRHRPGFTLIEVMVALTIGSLVVLLVHQAFGSAVDLSARLDAERTAHSARMAPEAAITRVFGSLDLSQSGFDGRRDRVTFAAALPATVRITIGIGGGRLVLQAGNAAADTLTPAEAVAFDYLVSYGSASSWVQEWHSPVSAPVAVRMRLRRDSVATIDTLLFIIGPRG